jgi:hypothetical protein
MLVKIKGHTEGDVLNMQSGMYLAEQRKLLVQAGHLPTRAPQQRRARATADYCVTAIGRPDRFRSAAGGAFVPPAEGMPCGMASSAQSVSQFDHVVLGLLQ